jgi:hypothetical protein
MLVRELLVMKKIERENFTIRIIQVIVLENLFKIESTLSSCKIL